MSERFAIGDVIEGIDQTICHHPVREEIMELDESLMGPNSARIKIDSVALPAPMKWVNTRLFKVIGRKAKP